MWEILEIANIYEMVFGLSHKLLFAVKSQPWINTLGYIAYDSVAQPKQFNT